MTAPSVEFAKGTSSGIGLVGRIPVRNLWLLMLYASELFRHTESARIAVEENPDDIADLVAEILSRQVERRLRRNLSFGFHSREGILGRVRGRIDLLATERHQLLDRGQVACRFDELTVNTARNRLVRSALDTIAGGVRRNDLARRCRFLASTLKQMGVIGDRPSRTEISQDRVGRRDGDDQRMVCAALLAFDLALPTEASGQKYLSSPDRETTWIRLLYEKGMAGFYDVVLSGAGWSVDAGKTMRWQVDRKTPGIDLILPSMRTDIVLSHMKQQRRIVVDTKFTSIVTRGWYREETLRSGYIYQMYAYLRSQEGSDDPLADTAAGLLLHPSIGATVDETVVIQGHQVRFATVDLSADSKRIRARLLQVLDPPSL